MTEQTIGPKSKKQELFINSEADITVFGGAAGAGKTHLGVMDFGKYVQYPRFRGIITRRTTPQLKGPGGVFDKARHMFKMFDRKVEWKEKDGKFVFTSGAEVYLKHFESEDSRQNFDGAEVNLFLVDEGQQFSGDMVTYLMSRMRNPACPEVKPHMKITCNPLKNSFLRKWVDWYLFQEGEFKGRPDPEKDGVIRWFIQRDGEMFWASSREELIEKFGPKARPMSFTFISANVYDNPVVMEINPDYVSWLENLKRVERERLLHGNWDANEEASGYFKREWLGDPVKQLPDEVIQRVRAWDIAGSLPSESLPNPDWTAGVLMAKTRSGKYVIEDVVRFRARYGEVLDKIIEVAQADGPSVSISLPREPGQAGQSAAGFQVNKLAEAGFVARARPTNKSKVLRFAPFAASAEAGNVWMVAGPWNETYLTELEGFDGSRNVKDDQVDATSDAFTTLAQNLHIPLFDLPDLKQDNPYKS